METPKISVAMAVYNGSRFLREQLDSIFGQSLLPFEVVAIDDCSSDESVKILMEYEKQGLKLYKNEQNLGAHKTFEKAILLCKGDFIAPSDQDDIWCKQKLEKSYTAIKSLAPDEPNLISVNQIVIDEFGTVLKSPNFMEKNINCFYDFFPILFCSAATLLFNKKLKEMAFPLRNCYTFFDIEIASFAGVYGNRLALNSFESARKFRVHNNNLSRKLQKKKFYKIRFFIQELFYKYTFQNSKNLNYIILAYPEYTVSNDKIVFLKKIEGLYGGGG